MRGEERGKGYVMAVGGWMPLVVFNPQYSQLLTLQLH